MWDYEFQFACSAWLQKEKAVRTACLVGIRTLGKLQSLAYHLWRFEAAAFYHNYQWSSKIANDVFNLYPIYDWKTTDIWTANGKFELGLQSFV